MDMLGFDNGHSDGILNDFKRLFLGIDIGFLVFWKIYLNFGINVMIDLKLLNDSFGKRRQAFH